MVPINVAQAHFHILRLARMSHLLRTASSSIMHEGSTAHDALVEWALAAIVADDGAAAASLPTSEE